MLERFEDQSVGYACFWKRNAGVNGAPEVCALNGQPFAELIEDAVSIDGEVADICTLAVSTCVSHNEFRSEDCAPIGTPDSTLCGFNGGADGWCREWQTNVYRCTMRCLSDEDCPEGSPCDMTASPRVCEL